MSPSVRRGAEAATAPSVHGLVAAQAAATPQAVAAACQGRQLSYAELDARANQLAWHLRSQGVTTESPVAVCLPRSADAVIALLAILKAGGAYLALDPAHPAPWHRTLLGDCGARVLVTCQSLLAELAGLAPTVTCLDGDPDLGRAPAVDPSVSVRQDNLAYIAYTSGSAGKPKGVCVTHGAVVRLVREPGFVTIGPGDAVLQLAPLDLDASTFEVWAPLVNGARLEIFPPPDPTPEEIIELAGRAGVTVMWLTAGLFHQVAGRPLRGMGSLRWLLAGGDVLSPQHVNQALAELPGIRLVNGYGPTENTTFTCCHVIGEQVETADVPIGQPVNATTVYVVDNALRAVDRDQPGELCTGGAGLARGYLGAPGLTAERFVPDPFAGPGARMYRTGDVAVMTTDGPVHFIGRRDQQLKVHGYRVEPGEVEAAIARIDGVRDVAVVGHEQPPGDIALGQELLSGDIAAGQAQPPGGRRLVAFVVASTPGSGPRIRGQLAAVLPGYAVPWLVLQVAKLPLTASGKVDRRNLESRPARERPDMSAPVREPGSDLERQLTGLWSELLGVPEIGVDDDFFELGGDSLLALRIATQITDAYDLEIHPRAFYENPTVAELARLIEEPATDNGQAAPRVGADGKG
jgi:amino acid adenylation domain-containing protein